jgi:predicted ATPase
VILSRLDRLSPNAFTLLAAGSVLGLSLTFDNMCAIANITPDTGLPALDELVSGQLLLETGQIGASGNFTFAHNMIRDVVYTEAGDARRHLFHQRAFQIFEKEQRPVSVLAHHALAAGLGEEAFQYSLAAGREAMLMSATREAIAHFENAHHLTQGGLVASDEDEVYIRDLYSQLGQAYELIGDHDQAVVIHDEWLRLGPQPS